MKPSVSDMEMFVNEQEKRSQQLALAEQYGIKSENDLTEESLFQEIDAKKQKLDQWTQILDIRSFFNENKYSREEPLKLNLKIFSESFAPPPKRGMQSVELGKSIVPQSTLWVLANFIRIIGAQIKMHSRKPRMNDG